MNFKKLAFWTTLFTTAAVPFATAQNPVIVQGNYVSHVFSVSNFIKNPNAQTNIADITTTGTASVTRSITTPLYATSEFNVSLNAGATISWATRNLDEGLKNQQCEARFTYRGFTTGTTTAEVVQNSVVVGSTPLTATATNPIIGSILFPCGTLAFATTFRLSQATANTSGTNEIGAIYIGLATNTAVASTRIWGMSFWADGGFLQYYGIPASSTTFSPTPAPFLAFNTTYKGNAQAPTGTNQYGLSITNLPVGDYTVALYRASRVAYAGATAGAQCDCYFRIRETSTNTVVTTSSQSDFWARATYFDQMAIGTFTNSSVGTRNFILEVAKSYDTTVSNYGQCGLTAFGSSAVFMVEPLFR